MHFAISVREFSINALLFLPLECTLDGLPKCKVFESFIALTTSG